MAARTPSSLKDISPDTLVRNPDNPRMIFREDELDKLLNSIKEVGIQVPLTVYEEPGKNQFVLMDGERRWICSRKLNLSTIPVIVQPKPTRLENILRMFNIHNVREQWDPMPSALKLREVIELIRGEKGLDPKVPELASLTGLSTATVRRYLSLLELPEIYQEMIKALNAVERHTPEIFIEIPKEKAMEMFVDKYKSNVITNIVKFRDVSRIARSEKAAIPREKVLPIIKKLIVDPKYSIEDAYHASVQSAYEERTLLNRIEDLVNKVSELKNEKHISSDILDSLRKLRRTITALLKKHK